MGQGPLIILSGPSGCGKSTLVARLLADSRWPLRLSVSVTTRPPRPGEVDGVNYHFWSRQRFQEEQQAGAFLEWAEVFGNFYGTLAREVEPYRQQGIGVLLEIDVQGWDQVRQRCPDAVSIFIRTSDLRICEERLRNRDTEREASIGRRLQGAQVELARAGEYNFQVINDVLDEALAQLQKIVANLFERNNHAG